jgi:choline-glycine betaine transporter
MSERVLRASTWTAVMGMIAVIGCAAVLLLQQAILAALDSAVPSAGLRFALATLLAVAGFALARYRRDLI